MENNLRHHVPNLKDVDLDLMLVSCKICLKGVFIFVSKNKNIS